MAGEPKEFKLPSKCASHHKWCEKDLTIQLSTWSIKQRRSNTRLLQTLSKNSTASLVYRGTKSMQHSL